MAARKIQSRQNARIDPTDTPSVLRAVLELLEWQRQIIADALHHLDGPKQPAKTRRRATGSRSSGQKRAKK